MSFSRALAILLLCSVTLSAGYLRRSTVTFPAASSGTLSNVTLATVTVSMADLATVAHGGQIQNATCTHVISNIPCDLVFTDDPTCATLTGLYKWGFETYDGAAGTARMWVLIPSLDASPVVPYVCFGDPSSTGSSYLGGAAGAEFDSNTQSVYHLPDGSSLSAADFKGSNSGTIGGPVATTGQIDGGASLNGSTDKITFSQMVAAGATAFTIECWINPARYGSLTSGNGFFYQGSASNQEGLTLMTYADSGTHMATLRWSFGSGTYGFANNNIITLSTWQHVAVTYNSGTLTFYVNGVSVGTASATNGTFNASSYIGFWYNSGVAARFFQGLIDEFRYSTIVRAPNWIATEYANQLNPPAMSAPVSLGSTPNRTPSGGRPIMFKEAGKEAGLDAANAVAGAASDVADKVGGAAKDLGLDLADAVSIVAGSINRLAEMGDTESSAWRAELAAWRGLLERGFTGNIGGMPFEIKARPQN